MRPWPQRSMEEAYLLNPAFCCLVLSSSIASYSELTANGFPYPLSYVILPIILHKETRDQLPKSSRTSMPSWIQENTKVRIQFGERVISLKPYTNEALLFGANHQWLNFNQDLSIRTIQRFDEINSKIKKFDSEMKNCMKKAKIVGEWFANINSVPAIMSFWGIRP